MPQTGSAGRLFTSFHERESTMRSIIHSVCAVTLTVLASAATWAADFEDTIGVFKSAGESSKFFNDSYGYAVFPTIGKGGVVVGAAYGEGHVYLNGKYVGDTQVTQLSVGAQLGGQAYSMIVFFKDKAAFDEFTHDGFEFGANASAVAITAGAQAGVSTQGASAGASVDRHDATTRSADWHDGMMVFTVARGGLMYEAAIAGQKFDYDPRS